MPLTFPRAGRTLLAASAAALALALPAGASAAGVALSTAGWSWTNPAPQGNTLTTLAFTGNTGYASGQGGTILRTDDGGTNWTGLYTGTGLPVQGLDLVDGNTLVARVGADGSCALRLSRDGGATFTRVVFDGTEASCATKVTAVDFISPTVGWVLLADGRVLRSVDGGASFGVTGTVAGGTNLLFTSETTGFATAGSTLRRTPDAGQTWSDVAPLPGGITSVRLISATTLVGWGSDVFGISVDGGVTWTTNPLGGVNPASVTCRSELVCAFYGGNQLVRTTDGGVTISKATIGNNDVQAVGFAGGARLVAVGTRGVTYLSDDDGATFRRTSTEPVAEALISIDNRGGGGPVGITQNGRIARVTGDGGPWSLLATLSTGRLADADFVDAKLGFALGENGTLQRTLNGGATWNSLDTGTPSPAKHVVAFSAESQILLGRFGIYRAGADGIFDAVSSKALRRFAVSGVDADGNRAFAWKTGKGGGIRATKDAGKTWSVVALPKGRKAVSQVAAIPGKGMLAVIDDRLFRASADTGKRWNEISGLGEEPSFVEVASSSEYLVVGTDREDTVLRTTNRGASFAAQSLAGAGSEVTTLAAAGPGKAYAAVTGGEAPALLATLTGGTRGTGSSLSLARTKKKQKAGSRVAINGALPGARGGESIHVAVRKVGAAGWTTATVAAGANGGSFTSRFRLKKGSYEVVAQWSGDFGRAGAGTKALKLTVTK